MHGFPNLKGTPSQNAFNAMTIRAEQNIIRDPVTKGVLGYTEAAGVTPLPGQTVNIYDPTGTDIIRTETGPTPQPAPQSGAAPGGGGLGAMPFGMFGNMFQPFDFSGFQNLMNQQFQNQPSQVASVQTALPQQKRMGSIGSTFGRGGMQIKSVNV